MSTSTVVFLIISASTFAILLVLAVALFLRNRASASSSVVDQEVPSIEQKAFSCDVELAVLEDTIQITNLADKPVRLEATSVDQNVELISSDQWVQRFGNGVNTYRVYASSADEQFEQVALELKVTSSEVAVRPVLKSETLQVMIWKLKPVLLASDKHLVERQVFSGRLQKTVNFDRTSGKYFRIRVATDGCKSTKVGLESRSNMGSSEIHQLLTVRVEPNKVLASNVSNRRMMVCVSQASAQTTLKRNLDEEEVQEMPLNGTFSFSILPEKSSQPKDLLRLQLSELSLLVEPHTKFGTVPLICDVRTTGRSAVDAFPQIISGEVMSQLQLPRKAYTYILVFYMRVASSSDVETSYTLQ